MSVTSMTSKDDKERFEQNFRDIFSKLNRSATNKTVVVCITILITFFTSFFGLIYVDLQTYKNTAGSRHIEVMDKIHDLELLVSGKSKTNQTPLSIVKNESAK